MIDLTKLQAGDTVKFRCGGEAVVANVEEGTRRQSSFNIWVYYNGHGTTHEFRYDNEGVCGQGLGYNSPFDIIEIIPKAFDWKDVKPGMAFKSSRGSIGHYIGGSNYDGEAVYIEWGRDLDTDPMDKKTLTRAPQHDIEVQK